MCHLGPGCTTVALKIGFWIEPLVNECIGSLLVCKRQVEVGMVSWQSLGLYGLYS
jgi:hypothetical protein